MTRRAEPPRFQPQPDKRPTLRARGGIPVPLGSLAIATIASLLACGCVRRQEVPTPGMLEAVKQRSEGVVAVATSLDQNLTHVTLCSGALVAPNLVLTARHCVSRAVTATPSCDARGRSHNGAHLAEDADPSQIAVYTGPEVRPEFDAPAARATRTLHPAGQVLCDADVAFIVLDRPLPGPFLPIRLHAPVQPGDLVVPVGFGGGPTNQVGLRFARDYSTVLAMGPTANADTGAVLGPREFEVDAATCRGDSGGPALDVRTGEIVGVVSRGGSCWAPGNHVYTRVDAYGQLVRASFVAASRAESGAKAIGAR